MSVNRSAASALMVAAVASTLSPTSVDAAVARKGCNNIYGSPLCIVVGGIDQTTFISTYYHKRSGPKRFIGLYVALCDTRGRWVYAGYISPGQVATGGIRRYVLRGGCHFGYMPIGNARYVTGALTVKSAGSRGLLQTLA